jgi:hypothetical protein
VVLHGRGGVVNAARRIALLLREHAQHLSFIVPYHCQSSATLVTLCADEVVAGPLALFSPVDPQLNGADGTAFSSVDIQQFGQMAQDWFGVGAGEARTEALALLCNAVFPPALAAFYRATREVQQVGLELLALGKADGERRQHIVQQLMTAYHSHHYALTGAELAALGLPVVRDASVEMAAWEISKWLQAHLGGAQRERADAPWYDAVLATRFAQQARQHGRDGLAGVWL